MMSTLAVFLVLAVAGSQAQAVTEVWLPDETTTHLSNPLIPKSIGIAKFWFDKLISCHIMFPSGIIYEIFPDEQTLPHETVITGQSAEPFNGCGVFFRNSPPSLSGTYELLSLVEHSADSSRTLTRQRFHLTFVEIDPWNAKVEDQAQEQVEQIKA